MSQSPFQEQNVPVIEVCCLCGRPLSGTSTLLFGNEQGQAYVDEQCACALTDLATGWEPGKLGEALRYVQRFLPYTHPSVHGYVDQYIARGLTITGASSQPAVPQGTQMPSYQGMAQGAQPPVYQGMPFGLYPAMRQDGQTAAEPPIPFVNTPDAQPTPMDNEPQDDPLTAQTEKNAREQSEKRTALRSERAERLFRVLARVVFAALVGLAAALLSTHGTGVPALPLVLGAWLTFAYTGGRWLFVTGHTIGMRYAELILYPDGESNLVLKSAAVVLSVLFSLLFAAVIGAINGVIELFNTSFGQNAMELYADENPARNREESYRR